VRKETTEIVELVLNQLKVEYREVLVLRQYDKLSYAEIAAITGNTVSSVESRLFKARKALAKKLAPYFQ
jgi:RNA polymerase sigma-70 factor (ECF subfamily)